MRAIPLLALIFAAPAFSQSLQDRVRARIGDFPGTVSLYAKNLDTEATFGIRETEPVRTASTIKLPIMIGVFEAVARGRAKWTEPITVASGERASGTGILGSKFSDGVQIPLRDAMHLMIVVSDNTVTNMVLERITADAVNTSLDKIGVKSTRSLRRITKPPSGFSVAGKLPETRSTGLACRRRATW